MHKEIKELLTETKKILTFHKAMGIDEYPATDVFQDLSQNGSRSMVKVSWTASREHPIPVKATRKRSEKQETKQQSIKDIASELIDCVKCDLHNQRSIILIGEGDHNADLMIIGDRPSIDADKEGTLYAGEAGKLLINMLKAINLKPEDVYFTTILKCRLHDNQPQTEEVNACLPFLQHQIQAISPKVIWVIGTQAGRILLKTTQSVLQLRGRFHDYQGIHVMATFSPEMMLQNTDLKKPTWADMQMIQKKLGFYDK